MDLKPPKSTCKDHITSKQTRDNVKTSVRLKKSSSTGLFRLFNKGTPNNSKQDSQSLCKASIEHSVTAGLREVGLEVVPCNYIRPSGLKLEPRSESESRRVISTSEFTSSPRRGTSRNIPPDDYYINPVIKLNNGEVPKSNQAKAIFQSRASKARILIKDIDENCDLRDNYFSLRSPMMSPVSPVHETGLPAFASLRLQFVVGRIAMNFESSAQWTSWLNSYSRGHFCINSPPDHPFLSPTFTHLPAVYPEEEEKRIATSRDFESISQEWIKRRAQIHMNSAMKRFGTRYGAVSFFDEDYEVFKAENGYNVLNVQRSSSIAAHALYTTEVLSIVDAEEDWRFRDNPIVTGKPKIRFFAATPLLSSNGHIIGVLSIFSRERRDSFDYDERLKLAKCGAALAADLRAQLKYVQASQPITPAHTPSIQNTKPAFNPIVKKVSPPCRDLIMKDSHFTRDLNNKEKVFGRETSPCSVLSHPTFGSLVQPLDQLLIRPNLDRSHVSAEHTPPSSVESSQGLGSNDERIVTVGNQTSFTTRPRADSIILSHRTSSKSRASSRATSINDNKYNTVDTSDWREGFNNRENNGRASSSHSHSLLRSSSPPPLPAPNNPCPRDVDSTSYDVNTLHKSDHQSNKKSNSPMDLKTLESSINYSPIQNSINQLQFFHPNSDVTIEDFLSLSDGDLIEESEETYLPETILSSDSQSPNTIPRDDDLPRDQLIGINCDPKSRREPQDNNSSNPDSSNTPRLQAKSKMPKSFLAWKFPENEASYTPADTSISDDTSPRNNDIYHSSRSSGLSSITRNETLERDEKQIVLKENMSYRSESNPDDIFEALSITWSNESREVSPGGDCLNSTNELPTVDRSLLSTK